MPAPRADPLHAKSLSLELNTQTFEAVVDTIAPTTKVVSVVVGSGIGGGWPCGSRDELRELHARRGTGGQDELAWTFERQGTKLEWRWKLQPSPNTQQTISEILDFLMDANIRLSEEVVRKTQSFDKLKQEAEKCLQQSERFNNEKAEFEQAAFSKFVAVLNSKKAKLRQLRDKVVELESAGKPPNEEAGQEQEEENSTDRTELFEGESDREAGVKDEPSSETGSGNVHSSPGESAATSRGRGRGRKKARK